MHRFWSLAVIAVVVSLVAVACTDDDTPSADEEATATSPAAEATTASTAEPTTTATTTATAAPTSEKRLEVAQTEGKVVYWVLPGPRRIDPDVFGTPDNPTMTGQEQIEQAQGQVKELLQQLPILVGLPPQARATSDDGTRYTQSTVATPFGDEGAIVTGDLDLTYEDRQPEDSADDPMATEDAASLTLHFTDPQQHEYEVELLRVFMPPIPGYQTQGGVLIDGFHHGTTGTGSPLMPMAYTYGAFWGIANITIDGELADEAKVTHCMTTNTVRDADYRLAFTGELPLPSGNTIAGQEHHTHCIVLPMTVTQQGPMFEPVKTAFELPNGQFQPFIHVMFEQDQIVESSGFTMPQSADDIQARYDAFTANSGASAADTGRTVTMKASEFQFDPAGLDGEPGETLHIVFENDGTIAHNLTIESLDVSTPTIQPGETAELTVTLPDDPGGVEFFCSVAGHREAGMTGTITVRAS